VDTLERIPDREPSLPGEDVPESLTHDDDVLPQDETSKISGQFLLPRLERSFRRSIRETQLRSLRIVGAAAAAAIIFGTLVDILVVGNDPPTIAIIVLVRAIVAGMILLVIVMADRWSDVERGFDRILVPAVLTLSLMTCGMVRLIRGELLLHALTALVLILIYYLFLPLSLRWAMAVSLLFSTCFLVSVCRFLAIRSDEFVQVILYLTLVNVLGALVSRERNLALRREFTVTESQRKIAKDLRNEIEARSRAERARMESENRFRTLVEMSPNAILVHRGGTIVYLNPTGQRLMGATDPEQLTGRSFIDFIIAPYRKSILERLSQINQTHEPLPPAELVVRTLAGREVPFSTTESLRFRASSATSPKENGCRRN